ncbi:MAG: hypothetical protein ABW321_28415 [Polyangiales bacterium]
MRSLAAWCCLGVVACGGTDPELDFPDVDTQRFYEQVYPVLLADCGFPACHGSAERFFAVYGPGRTRLDPETDIYAPATSRELALSYSRARSMLLGPEGPRRSPLLRKPLAISAGGAAHEGDDPWGNAVIPNKRDPRYEALFFWAIGNRSEEAPP